jgi:pantoate--beta-alanine ligase
MRAIETVSEIQTLMRDWRRQGVSVGFVPTMGALHAGHLALVERAKLETERVVVSIFVNPTQFNDPQDLERYPRPLDKDLAMLSSFNVDAAFLPEAREMYADNYNYAVSERDVSRLLCGPFRPGHFDGMLTVVLKLLNLVPADKAYFGEKDYQQLKLIGDMARALFLPTQIVGCQTVREPDGLAMSSRNLLLTGEQRQLAPAVYRTLKTAHNKDEVAETLTKLGFRVDYVEEHWGRRFAAAFLGNVRLIDNVEI